MSRKTQTKWKTNKCGRCGNHHNRFTGKLDSKGIEYVICSITNKRMNISGIGLEGHSFLFPILWGKEISL